MPTPIVNLIETITLLGSEGEGKDRWRWRILRLLAEVVEGDAALLFLPSEGGWERLAARAAEPGSGGAARGPWVDRRVLPGAPRGILEQVLAGVPDLDPASQANAEWDGIDDVPGDRVMGTTVNLGRGAAGMLAAWNPRAGGAAFTLAAAAAALGAALRNRDFVRRLEAEAVTDDLTGIYNYRYLRQTLGHEVKRAARHHFPLAILMIDVDNLKEYNSRFGHLEGSQVLKQMAGIFRAGIRDVDLVAKYGGDEFMVVLPHSTREGASVVAERLRQEVAATAFPHVGPGVITCSIGIAVFPEDATQPLPLVAAADQALFAAKGSGKNRVAA